MIDRTAKKFSWRAMAVAAGLTLAPAMAHAQDAAAPAAPSDAAALEELQQWTKVCNPDPTTNQQGCAVYYRLFANATTVIAQVSLSFLLDDPDTIVLSVWIPTAAGIFVDQGLGIKVDTSQPTVVPYRLCDPQICIAEDNVAPAFVNALKAGGQLFIDVAVPNQDTGTQVVELPISLIGFTAAYDGPGLTPDEAQAAQDTLNQALQDRAEAARQALIEQQNQLNANPAPAASP
jgi:invasion protein IalB